VRLPGAVAPGSSLTISFDDPVTGTWEGTEFGKTLKLDKVANDRAKQLLADAKKSAETVKPKMEGIEAKMPGSRLEGTDFQLKGADSLKRKLATELAQSAGNLDATAAGINDALRYTLVLPEATYAAGVSRAVELLQAADMQVTKLKNFWKTNKDTSGYRGINLTV
jgi:hypothetical protein